MTFEETGRANDSSTKDVVSLVLLAIAAICAIVGLIKDPFLFGPIALFLSIIAISISVKRRAIGIFITFGVTLCWIVGAAIAVWQSNALY
jgi:hypothetical protein